MCVFVKFAHSLPSGVPGEGGRSGLGGACILFPLQGPSLPQVDGGGVGGLAGQAEWEWGGEETQIPRRPVSPAAGYIRCTFLGTGNDLSPG